MKNSYPRIKKTCIKLIKNTKELFSVLFAHFEQAFTQRDAVRWTYLRKTAQGILMYRWSLVSVVPAEN